jgi:hypothetical protein
MYTYTRTEKALAEIRSKSGVLPRKLRGILAVIDSRTTHSTYVKMLNNFGDVEMLLEILVDEGYLVRNNNSTATSERDINNIEMISTIKNQNTEKTNHAPSATNWAQTAAETNTFVAKNDVIELYSNSNSNNNSINNINNKDGLLKQIGNKIFNTNSDLSQKGKSIEINKSEKHYVGEILNEMNDFVSKYMNIEAVEIMLILEQITTLKELEHTFRSYEELVRTLGDVGKTHALSIKSKLNI